MLDIPLTAIALVVDVGLGLLDGTTELVPSDDVFWWLWLIAVVIVIGGGHLGLQLRILS